MLDQVPVGMLRMQTGAAKDPSRNNSGCGFSWSSAAA